MGYDQDPPTRRLSPQQPADPARTGVRETEYATGGPTPAEAELRDRLRSLQTALAFVGVLAAIALGVALWSLLSEDEPSGAQSASPERVDRLQDRVATLEEQMDQRATKSSVADLRSDVERLQADVDEASAGAEGGEETQAAVETLQGDVEELQQQVADLAAQSSGGEQAQP